MWGGSGKVRRPPLSSLKVPLRVWAAGPVRAAVVLPEGAFRRGRRARSVGRGPQPPLKAWFGAAAGKGPGVAAVCSRGHLAELRCGAALLANGSSTDSLFTPPSPGYGVVLPSSVGGQALVVT